MNEQKIKDFFSAYEARFNKALGGEDNIDDTTAAFAECFINANPSGVFCGQNNEEFRKAIPKGNDFYRGIGTQSMTINSLEITELDTIHFMVKASWHSVYKKKEETIEIGFSVIYLLQHRENGLKIFAYVTGDEQKVLQEAGLLPAG